MNKSTILYDHQIFDIQNYGGISRYFANIIEGVQHTENLRAKLPLVYCTNYYIRNSPQLINKNIGKILLRKSRKRERWNRYFAKTQLKKSDFEVFHATYFNPYFLDYLKKPLVITVHDMIYENHPHLFPNAEEVIRDKRMVIESADVIIAISEFTKQEILQYFPHLASKVKVIYHGLPETSLAPARESLPEKYLLYVGDRVGRYKNFKPLVQSIAPLLEKNAGLYFVCAGGGHFDREETDLLKELRIDNKVLQMNVSDALMMQLYQQATVFIYPSLEEGFGLPILEAFKYGCPVACSNTSCLPEVGGGAVSYFSPADLASMHTTISTLTDSPELRIKQINDGFEQVKLFTFTNCLDQTLGSYNTLITS